MANQFSFLKTYPGEDIAREVSKFKTNVVICFTFYIDMCITFT